MSVKPEQYCVVNRQQVIERVFQTCFTLILALGFVTVLVRQIDGPSSTFLGEVLDVTVETGAGNFLSTALALGCGVLAGLIFWRERLAGWAWVASFFVYVAFDDATGFHEAVGTWIAPSAQEIAWLSQLFPTYAWHIVYAPLLAAVTIFMLVFLVQALTTAGQKKLLFGAVTCFALAVVMDFVEGTPSFSVDMEAVEFYLRVVEELLEMMGASLFLVLFLDVLLPGPGDIRIAVE